MVMTRDQEQQIVDALLAVDEMETRELLLVEGLSVVQRILGPSLMTAHGVLDDLQARGLVAPAVARAVQLQPA
jgi:hypothetical protein